MILFYNANGNLIKITPEHVYQGSDGATTLYFVAPIVSTAAVSVAFTLLDGKRTAKHILTPFTGELDGVTDENGNVFKIWSVDLDGHITAYSGIATAQFFITINGIIRATQAANFTVEEGVPPVVQPAESNVYDEIITYIQEVWEQISAEIATKQDIIDADNKLNADYIENGTTNKVFTATDKNKLDGIESGAQVNDVDSVNGKMGAVVLDADDIPDTNTTNKFVSAEEKEQISTNKSNIDTINSKIPSAASSSNKLVDNAAMQSFAMPITTKYGANLSLVFNSANGVLTAQLKDQDGNNLGQAQTVTIDLQSIETAINGILDLIPAQASASNQLADKNFVNSSISTNTAHFIGTFNSLAELKAYSGTVTNNDYANVINGVITNNGSDFASKAELDAYPTTNITNFDYAWVVNGSKFDLYRYDLINEEWDLRVEHTDKDQVTLNTVYNRYKANVLNSVITWEFEFTINNTTFTAVQWAAINSGITASLVSNYNVHIVNKNNPHEVTKEQVGLGNVDNTSDLNKPVSNPQQAALDALKQDIKSGQIVAGQALTSKAINPVSEESGTIQETPFISQGTATANNTSPVDTSPIGKQLEKQGNTIVYNQLVQNGNFENTDGWGTEQWTDISFSVVDNEAVIEKTAANVQGIVQQSIPAIVEHKYLIQYDAYADTDNLHAGYGYSSVYNSLAFQITTQKKTYSAIITANSTYSYFYIYCYDIGTYHISNVRMHDLTKWFNGNDNIPFDLLSHSEHFSWHYNGDLSYNVGELRNCAGRYLECGQGRNIYNPEETYNRVIPNIEYYYYGGSATTITYYDNNRNIISTESVSSDTTFTTPSNCWYINSSVTSNITISEYYSTGDGYDEYYPYVPPVTYDTGTEVLRRVNSVKDTKAPDGTITRNIGTIDLGTVRWNGSNGNFSYELANNGFIVKGLNLAQILCAKYPIGTQNDDKTIRSNGGYIAVYDTTYSDAQSFETAMSGVILYYELATPTTEQGTAFSENIQINDYSYQAWKDTSNDYVSIPQGTKLFYPADYVLLVDSLNSYTNGDVTSLAKKSDLVNKQDKLTQSTDLTPTTQTLTLSANTRYALGTLTALNLTFPASGNDGDEIIVEFISGSTATTLTLDNVNAIYNFSSVNSDKFVELNAQYKVSVGKWVVYSAETDYTAV